MRDTHTHTDLLLLVHLNHDVVDPDTPKIVKVYSRNTPLLLGAQYIVPFPPAVGRNCAQTFRAKLYIYIYDNIQ